jgi:hypothetical protein
VGSNEDCRNRESRIDEVSVKLNSAHRRHLDIGDQAVRFDEMRRCDEIGSRRESLDGVAQRLHEGSHGIPEQTIIFNDGDHQRFRHAAFRRFA